VPGPETHTNIVIWKILIHAVARLALQYGTDPRMPLRSAGFGFSLGMQIGEEAFEIFKTYVSFQDLGALLEPKDLY
jgi:hypothetical protein